MLLAAGILAFVVPLSVVGYYHWWSNGHPSGRYCDDMRDECWEMDFERLEARRTNVSGRTYEILKLQEGGGAGIDYVADRSAIDRVEFKLYGKQTIGARQFARESTPFKKYQRLKPSWI